jgi:rRNA maturation endonuclease Nob1
MKTLLVSDANVFIDIENAVLTKELFHLSYQFAVPDVLFEEELRERHSHLPHFGLKIMILNSEYVAKVFDLAQKY